MRTAWLLELAAPERRGPRKWRNCKHAAVCSQLGKTQATKVRWKDASELVWLHIGSRAEGRVKMKTVMVEMLHTSAFLWAVLRRELRKGN